MVQILQESILKKIVCICVSGECILCEEEKGK